MNYFESDEQASNYYDGNYPDGKRKTELSDATLLSL